jgi:epoxyqueuosine reductase
MPNAQVNALPTMHLSQIRAPELPQELPQELAQELAQEQAQALADRIKTIGLGLGFQQVGITDLDLSVASIALQQWLAEERHGSMHYMAAHGAKRWRPAELVPGTVRVISVRMDYLPEAMHQAEAQLAKTEQAYVSRYALGRDYHKLMRRRLQKFADAVSAEIGEFGYRVFTDSAPVLEKPLAEKAGLGWIGKHTNLINSSAGSWFFLGEIYVALDLPIDAPASQHCGSCTRCISACPTGAITAPFELDARLCISYLTIEFDGSIPLPLRPLMGNRIYGCDDCQLVCPWNKFAALTGEPDFHARHRLDRASLLELFAWSEADFLRYTEGSAIRRIGYARWRRNLAVALGNAPHALAITSALTSALLGADALLAEHIEWALEHQRKRAISASSASVD